MTTSSQDEDLRVSFHLGLTLPGPQEYSSFRADVTLTGIDPRGDVPEQLRLQQETLAAASAVAQVSLAEETSNAMNLSLEGLGLETQLKQFRKRVKAWMKEVEAKLGVAAGE